MAHEIVSHWTSDVCHPVVVHNTLSTATEQTSAEEDARFLHHRVSASMEFCRSLAEKSQPHSSYFGANAPENVPTVFRPVDDGEDFATKKPFKEQQWSCSGNSGDDTRLNAIMKNNWMEKRISQPASAILTCRIGIDWTGSQWVCEEQSIYAKYSKLQSSVGSHGANVLLLVVQTAAGNFVPVPSIPPQTPPPQTPGSQIIVVETPADVLAGRLYSLRSRMNMMDSLLFMTIHINDLGTVIDESAKYMMESSVAGNIPTVPIMGPRIKKIYDSLREVSIQFYASQVARALQTMEYRVSRCSGGATGSSPTGRLKPSDVKEIGLLRSKYTIKAAVYSEYQGKHLDALGYYRKAFQAMCSIVEGVSDAVLNHLQYMAEVCNYKICRYLIYNDCNIDAKSQLESLIVAMKDYYNVEYVHYGWLSKQYMIFLDLLHSPQTTEQKTSSSKRFSRNTKGKNMSDVALAMCRSNYYVSAAKLEVRRKLAFAKYVPQNKERASFAGGSQNVTEQFTALTVTPFYAQLSASERKGKRTSIFRTASTDRSASDGYGYGGDGGGGGGGGGDGGGSGDEITSIASLQAAIASSASETPGATDAFITPVDRYLDIDAREAKLDYFSQVMTLLEKALQDVSATQKRRRAQIEALIADEYMTQGKFESASAKLMPGIHVLTTERWLPLLVPLLRKRMACAIYLGNAPDYLSAALNLYSIAEENATLLTRYEKEELHKDLMSVMLPYPPAAGNNLNSTAKPSNALLFSPGGVSLTNPTAYEGIFQRPEYGMATALGHILDQHLPHAYVYESSGAALAVVNPSASGISSKGGIRVFSRLISVEVAFARKRAEVAGKAVQVSLTITSLFHSGSMRFAEMAVNFCDDIYTQRFINLPATYSPSTATCANAPIPVLLEFDYKKPVVISFDLDLPEERMQAVLEKSSHACYLCVESVDFVLRSDVPKGIVSPAASPGSSKNNAEAACDPETEVGSASPGITDTALLDFILKVYTVPDKLIRSRAQDLSMGLVNKTYGEYVYSWAKNRSFEDVDILRYLPFKALRVDRPVAHVKIEMRLSKRVNTTRAGSTCQILPSPRTATTVNSDVPAAPVEMGAVVKVEKEIMEPSLHFNLLRGPLQRINIVFNTGSSAMLNAKLFLSCTQTFGENPDGADAMFWYPHIGDVASGGGSKTENPVFHPMKVNNFTMQPVHPITFADCEANTFLVVPLFLRCESSVDVCNISLRIQYLPHAEALNKLDKTFTISVSFVRPFQVSFRLSSHADTCTDAAVGLEMLRQQRDGEITPAASASADSKITMHREEITTLSAKVTCVEALGGELVLQNASLVLNHAVSAEESAKGIRAENIELLDGDGDDRPSSKRIVSVPTPLRRGEEYIGSVDLLCHPLPKQDMSQVPPQASANATRKLLFENFSEDISNSSYNPDDYFRKVSTKAATPRSLGHLVVEWKRASQDLLAVPILQRPNGMTIIAGKYTRTGSPSYKFPKGNTNSSPIMLLPSSRQASQEMKTVSLSLSDEAESAAAQAGDAVMTAVSSTSSLASAAPNSSSNNLVDGDTDPSAETDVFDQNPLGDGTDDADAAELHLEPEAVFETGLPLSLQHQTDQHNSSIPEPLKPFAWLPKLGAADSTDFAELLNLNTKCSEICSGNIIMPIAHFLDNPFRVSVTMPSRGRLGCQVNLNIRITSNLTTLERVKLMVLHENEKKTDILADIRHDNTRLSHTAGMRASKDASSSNSNSRSGLSLDSAFMISGPTLQTIVVAPGETIHIPILLIPLDCGLLSVPNIILTWQKCAATILNLKKSIFVGPMEVGGASGSAATSDTSSAYASILAL